MTGTYSQGHQRIRKSPLVSKRDPGEQALNLHYLTVPTQGWPVPERVAAVAGESAWLGSPFTAPQQLNIVIQSNEEHTTISKARKFTQEEEEEERV